MNVLNNPLTDVPENFNGEFCLAKTLNYDLEINKDNRIKLEVILKKEYENRYRHEIKFITENCSIDSKNCEIIIHPTELGEGQASITIESENKNCRSKGSKLTINYETKEEIHLDRLEIKNSEYKDMYIEGENFDASNFVIKAIYENGLGYTITDYEIENGENLQLGQKSVKITYDGVELNVPIKVYSKDNYCITISKGVFNAISEVLSEDIVYSEDYEGEIRCIVKKEGIDNLTHLNISSINFGYDDKADYTGLSKLYNLKKLEVNGSNIYNQKKFFDEICQLEQLEQLKLDNCWFENSDEANVEYINEVLKLPSLQLIDFGEQRRKSGGWIEDRVCYLPKYLTQNDIENINVKCRHKSNTGENVFEDLPIYEDENGYLYILLDTEVNEEKLYTSYSDSIDTGRMVEINILTEKIQQKINYYYDWNPETEKPKVEITTEPVNEENTTDSDTITYTFNWNEKVYGFTKDSIIVENGEKGEFTEITPNQAYSLVVTNNVKDGQKVAQKIIVDENVCEDLASNGNVKAEKEITIERKKVEKLNVEAEVYEIKNEETTNYIEKILPNTSIQDLKQKIETNGTIEIYKGEEKVTDEEKLIGTGMEIVVKLGNEEVRYIALIIGDLTGDGKMGIGDLTKLSRYAAGLDNNLSGAYLKASDLVKDRKYGTISDILKMSRVLAGLDSL